jgi:predicted NBD/HSP70 family sugar kinase
MREAQRAILEAPSTAPIDERPDTLEALMGSADPRLRAVVDRAARLLARALIDMSRVLDPELIVLGGPLVAVVGDAFAAATRAAVERLGELGASPPRVEVSRIGSDAGVIGAATLVLHDVYAPSAHKLSLIQERAA